MNDSGGRITKTPWVRLILIGLVGTVPFLHKPVHVDDPVFLGVAVRILEHPWDPYTGGEVWRETAWNSNFNPPLWSYLLALLAVLVGWELLAFQLLAAAAFLMLVFATFQLVRRFSGRPLLWTSFVASAPFLLPGRNLMVDVPMWALWLWSLELECQAWFDERPGRAWWAGLLAALAMLTKYTACLLIPLLLYGAWRFNKPRSLAALVPIALLLGAWCLHNMMVYGTIHLLDRVDGAAAISVPEKSLIFLRGTGSVVLLTPVWWLVFCRRQGTRWILAIAILCLAALVGHYDQRQATVWQDKGGVDLDISHQIQFATFTTNGLLALFLGLAVATARLQSVPPIRSLFLAWAALGLVFNLFLMPGETFGAIRHYVVYLLPMILASIPAVEVRASMSAWMNRLTVACVSASIGLGFALAHADFALAATYPRTANEIIRPLVPTRTVWFHGDSSFRYYAEKAGGRVLHPGDPSLNERLHARDLIVAPRLQAVNLVGAPFLSRCKGLKRIEYESHNPLRTIAPNANYYGGSLATLPWEFAPMFEFTQNNLGVFVDLPIEEVLIYEVR